MVKGSVIWSGVRLPGRSNRMQCYQRLATSAAGLRICAAKALHRGDGPDTRYTTRDNTRE